MHLTSASRVAFLRLRPPAFWVLGLCVLGFAAMALTVVSQGHDNWLDTQASHWASAQRSPRLTRLLLPLTHLHSVAAITAYTVVMALLLILLRRHRHWLAPLLWIVAGGAVFNGLMKQVFQRPRPSLDEALLHLSTFSFPSGHASGATLLYSFLALVVLVHVRSRAWRGVVAVAALAIVALVAWSRVYLGVHFFTDVLGGVFEGLAWASICVILLSARPRPPG